MIGSSGDSSATDELRSGLARAATTTERRLPGASLNGSGRQGTGSDQVLGGNLHGIEERGSLFGLDAAVQHQLADLGNCSLDGRGVFEPWKVDVMVGEEFIARRDGSFAHDFVIVATPLALDGWHSAGVATGVSHLTTSVRVFFGWSGRRR